MFLKKKYQFYPVIELFYMWGNNWWFMALSSKIIYLLSISELDNCFCLQDSRISNLPVITGIFYLYRRSHRMCSVKSCSWTFCKIYRKTPVPKSFFNEVAGVRLATLFKKRHCHWCFPVNFEKFSRTPSLKNTSGQLEHGTTRTLKGFLSFSVSVINITSTRLL